MSKTRNHDRNSARPWQRWGTEVRHTIRKTKRLAYRAQLRKVVKGLIESDDLVINVHEKRDRKGYP